MKSSANLRKVLSVNFCSTGPGKRVDSNLRSFICEMLYFNQFANVFPCESFLTTRRAKTSRLWPRLPTTPTNHLDCKMCIYPVSVYIYPSCISPMYMYFARMRIYFYISKKILAGTLASTCTTLKNSTWSQSCSSSTKFRWCQWRKQKYFLTSWFIIHSPLQYFCLQRTIIFIVWNDLDI